LEALEKSNKAFKVSMLPLKQGKHYLVTGAALAYDVQNAAYIRVAGTFLQDRLYQLIIHGEGFLMAFGEVKFCFKCGEIAQHRHHGIVTRAMARGVTNREFNKKLNGGYNIFPLCVKHHAEVKGKIGHVNRDVVFRWTVEKYGYGAAVKIWEDCTNDLEQYTKEKFARVDYVKYKDVEQKKDELDF
jgi:hypothetical protein